jgi:uncharacterized protein (TIGR03086 family)
MDIMELRMKSADTADGYIHAVREDQWSTQSNCTEWTVKQLVNHMVNENYWEPELLAGKTIKEVGDRFEGDLVGNNPVEVWEKSIREANAKIEATTPAIDKMCHLSYGDVPCHEYLSQRILDLTIHGWDVAKSTGQPLVLPPELVQFLWDTFSRQEEMLRSSGLFGKQISVPPGSELQTKLLALLGRQ